MRRCSRPCHLCDGAAAVALQRRQQVVVERARQHAWVRTSGTAAAAAVARVGNSDAGTRLRAMPCPALDCAAVPQPALRRLAGCMGLWRSARTWRGKHVQPSHGHQQEKLPVDPVHLFAKHRVQGAAATRRRPAWRQQQQLSSWREAHGTQPRIRRVEPAVDDVPAVHEAAGRRDGLVEQRYVVQQHLRTAGEVCRVHSGPHARPAASQGHDGPVAGRHAADPRGRSAEQHVELRCLLSPLPLSLCTCSVNTQLSLVWVGPAHGMTVAGDGRSAVMLISKACLVALQWHTVASAQWHGHCGSRAQHRAAAAAVCVAARTIAWPGPCVCVQGCLQANLAATRPAPQYAPARPLPEIRSACCTHPPGHTTLRHAAATPCPKLQCARAKLAGGAVSLCGHTRLPPHTHQQCPLHTGAKQPGSGPAMPNSSSRRPFFPRGPLSMRRACTTPHPAARLCQGPPSSGGAPSLLKSTSKMVSACGW